VLCAKKKRNGFAKRAIRNEMKTKEGHAAGSVYEEVPGRGLIVVREVEGPGRARAGRALGGKTARDDCSSIAHRYILSSGY
jgi:hypothetical protein